MSPSSPIGIFDSGLGGLSVLREIRRVLPAESLVYVADSGHAPYGEKSQEFIVERSRRIARFLHGQGAKALVIACNTATAAAADTLRKEWPGLPVIGMEPAVKPAAAATRRGVVGVLATTGTLSSSRFAALLDTFGKGVQVITRPGIGLVECVERAEIDSAATRALLASHLQPLLDAGADVIVLGCTHYVFLRAQVEAIVGPKIAVIDTGLAVAEYLRNRLHQADALGSGPARPTRFWTSGDVAAAGPALQVLLGDEASASPLPDNAGAMQ